MFKEESELVKMDRLISCYSSALNMRGLSCEEAMSLSAQLNILMDKMEKMEGYDEYLNYKFGEAV